MLRLEVWVTFQLIVVQIWVTKAAAPPRVEKPALLDSFIPAAMQDLAHLTELMKYDTRPTGLTTLRPLNNYPAYTSTTIRPTLPHRPAIYAPQNPLGPSFYFANQRYLSYRDYLDRLQQPSGLNYFDRYQLEPLENYQSPLWRSLNDDQDLNIPEIHTRNARSQIPAEFYLYFGTNFTDILRSANRADPVEIPDNNIDTQVYEFTKEYDDNRLRIEYNKKQIPPTRAYVTLLSLYDLLNKESKKLGLNKYQGYTEAVLYELIKSAQTTSANQLKFILGKVIDRQDTRDAKITQKIKELIKDIDDQKSYINLATRYIPPLVFAS